MVDFFWLGFVGGWSGGFGCGLLFMAWAIKRRARLLAP
jgi:hypothetical protein